MLSYQELLKLTVSELNKESAETAAKLAKAKLEQKNGSNAETHAINDMKSYIARIETAKTSLKSTSK